jgi:4-hydroxy-tetrahydrodipicolinate synthase
MNFKGIYTALITPFKTNGSLDEAGFIELLDRQIEAKSQGVVILGTTGESPTITGDEKLRMIQTARSKIKAPMQLIIGTGTNSTETTIAETRIAEKEGADGALVVAPYYNKPTQEGLFLHYQALAEATKLPIIIYNIAGRTGVNIQTSTIKRLMEFPSIVGIKEASGCIPQMMDMIEMRQTERPDFMVLSGDDNLTLPLLALGGNGVVSVASNLIPELMQDLYGLCLKGDWESAKALHYQLLPLFKGIFLETNPIPIKTLMNFNNLPSGPCRLPLTNPLPENEKHLRHLHEMIKMSLLTRV